MARRKRITMTVANPAPRKRNKNKQQQQQQQEDDDDVPYLPNDILLKTLETLPAQYLYGVVRCVSKTLAHDILHTPSFIESQLLRSDFAGFVLQYFSFKGCNLYLAQFSRQGSQLQFSMKHLGFKSGILCGSCDGVLLMYMDSLVPSSGLFLANPVTKQVRRLLDHPNQVSWFSYTKLAHIPETGVFKVVTVADSSTFLILTVGSHMSWRKLSAGCFSAECFLQQIAGLDKAVCVDGVLYWPAPMCAFALDIRADSFHRIELPESFHHSPLRYYLVQIGKDVCFIRFLSGLMETWVLKDFRRNEWVLLERGKLQLDFEFRIKYLAVPLLYLESEQTMVLKCDTLLSGKGSDAKVMAYNMVTGKRDFFNVCIGTATTFKHTSSLVRL